MTLRLQLICSASFSICKNLSSEQLANNLWSDVSSVKVPAHTNRLNEYKYTNEM